jgi:hypothetical protein
MAAAVTDIGYNGGGPWLTVVTACLVIELAAHFGGGTNIVSIAENTLGRGLNSFTSHFNLSCWRSDHQETRRLTIVLSMPTLCRSFHSFTSHLNLSSFCH